MLIQWSDNVVLSAINETTKSSDSGDSFNPTRNALKAVLIIVLFFVTFLAGISAFFLCQFVTAHRSCAFTKAFSFVSVFGAGIFLATCLLDLLPESLECFEQAGDLLNFFNRFPFPELCIAVGFLLVLILEQSILYASERRWIGNAETGRLLNVHGELEGRHHLAGRLPFQHEHHHHLSHVHPPQFHNMPAMEDSAGSMTIELDAPSRASGAAAVGEEDDSHPTDMPSGAPLLLPNGGDEPPELPPEHSSVRVLLLVFALSLHAVFEGLSMGMIADVPVLLQVFFALLIHKAIIGFSLGIRVFQSRLRRAVGVMCCAVFAGQVIIGGFIGIVVVDIMNHSSKVMSSLISGILQGIACGTFLYITCFEILPHELNHRADRPAKMLFLMLGFTLIAFFVYFYPA